MFVLIQNTKSREYYVEGETWTGDPEAAKQFRSTVDALEYIQHSKLVGVHLLMKMGKPEFDVHLKVDQEKHDSTP